MTDALMYLQICNLTAEQIDMLNVIGFFGQPASKWRRRPCTPRTAMRDDSSTGWPPRR